MPSPEKKEILSYLLVKVSVMEDITRESLVELLKLALLEDNLEKLLSPEEFLAFKSMQQECVTTDVMTSRMAT